MSLKDLKNLMQNHSSFENVFAKELQECYDEAEVFSEAGDDRKVAVKLAQATVWKRLHKLAKAERS